MVPLCLCSIALFYILDARIRPPLSFFGDDLQVKRPVLNLPFIGDNKHSKHAYPVTLSISPKQLTTPNGVQDIQMSWSGATMATNNDWIGIYSPPNSSNAEYLDWFHTDGATTGEYQARVWNMRDDYQIRYFATNNDQYTLQGISNTATVMPNQPLQGHISLTKNSPYEMQIRWVSSFIQKPSVQIGIKTHQYTKTFNATYYTYDTTKMCGGGASVISPTQFRHPGFIYTSIVKDLKPDTRYYYRFGNDEYWSGEQTFITSSSDPTKGFGFIMYGDQGTYANCFPQIVAVQNEIERKESDIQLILHVGDISYAWGNGYTWEIWSNMIAQVASSVPYMVTVGNHEYDHAESCNDGDVDVSGTPRNGYHPPWGNLGDDSSGECGAPMYYRFDADISAKHNSIFWYSFNYNSVHFIMLSSEHNYSRNAPAYTWLVDDLQNNVDRKATPWIIVSIHRPLYESEIYEGDNVVDAHLLQMLEPVLYKYGVDMVLAGHFHSYERSCAVYNYSCIGKENGGIVHLTIGTAGIDHDSALYAPDPYIIHRNEIDYGYGKFYVNATTLVAQFISSDIHSVIDEVVLKK